MESSPGWALLSFIDGTLNPWSVPVLYCDCCFPFQGWGWLQSVLHVFYIALFFLLIVCKYMMMVLVWFLNATEKRVVTVWFVHIVSFYFVLCSECVDAKCKLHHFSFVHWICGCKTGTVVRVCFSGRTNRSFKCFYIYTFISICTYISIFVIKNLFKLVD